LAQEQQQAAAAAVHAAAYAATMATLQQFAQPLMLGSLQVRDMLGLTVYHDMLPGFARNGLFGLVCMALPHLLCPLAAAVQGQYDLSEAAA
jgi:hypothetical protein